MDVTAFDFVYQGYQVAVLLLGVQLRITYIVKLLHLVVRYPGALLSHCTSDKEEGVAATAACYIFGFEAFGLHYIKTIEHGL